MIFNRCSGNEFSSSLFRDQQLPKESQYTFPFFSCLWIPINNNIFLTLISNYRVFDCFTIKCPCYINYNSFPYKFWAWYPLKPSSHLQDKSYKLLMDYYIASPWSWGYSSQSGAAMNCNRHDFPCSYKLSLKSVLIGHGRPALKPPRCPPHLSRTLLACRRSLSRAAFVSGSTSSSSADEQLPDTRLVTGHNTPDWTQ